MEYTIKLTAQELQAVVQGLGELPLKVSLNLFTKIQQQVSASQTEADTPQVQPEQNVLDHSGESHPA